MSTQRIILDAHKFLVDATLQAQWSRKLYRHESGQGTVIEFDHWGGVTNEALCS